MSFMNIPYRINEKSIVFSCHFISIWEVQANDAYHTTKDDGFDVPGMFITYDGKGILKQLNQTYELQVGTYIILQEGIPCSYKCESDDWKFYFIDFSSLDMTRYLKIPIREVVPTGKIGEAIQKCEHIIDILIEQQHGYVYAASILLQEILLIFAKEQTSAIEPQYQELNKVIIYMHKHIGKIIRSEELVHMSGLSRTTFFTRFRAKTGLSPSDYMLKLKLESAKISLETTSQSVKEISANLHFYDEFHFSKLFKRNYGVSPSSFRSSK
ncbi:AraC family transcriptional regulator [Paenibacillus psychroresistens]|uniref:AraC family transcriptional regulator n=1 Tax=Paenibacillus psychroresistens TaxID=1778678 RepID=A0A6B8RMR9_9BACL|nr:AraC family transcriptional regulator [Paenibacillus psychroresistens]QGQ97339.1 AraC family transcriptional regulator [Paenibacillus psychroresistens]